MQEILDLFHKKGMNNQLNFSDAIHSKNPKTFFRLLEKEFDFKEKKVIDEQSEMIFEWNSFLKCLKKKYRNQLSSPVQTCLFLCENFHKQFTFDYIYKKLEYIFFRHSDYKIKFNKNIEELTSNKLKVTLNINLFLNSKTKISHDERSYKEDKLRVQNYLDKKLTSGNQKLFRVNFKARKSSDLSEILPMYILKLVFPEIFEAIANIFLRNVQKYIKRGQYTLTKNSRLLTCCLKIIAMNKEDKSDNSFLSDFSSSDSESDLNHKDLMQEESNTPKSGSKINNSSHSNSSSSINKIKQCSSKDSTKPSTQETESINKKKFKSKNINNQEFKYSKESDSSFLKDHGVDITKDTINSFSSDFSRTKIYGSFFDIEKKDKKKISTPFDDSVIEEDSEQEKEEPNNDNESMEKVESNKSNILGANLSKIADEKKNTFNDTINISNKRLELNQYDIQDQLGQLKNIFKPKEINEVNDLQISYVPEFWDNKSKMYNIKHKYNESYNPIQLMNEVKEFRGHNFSVVYKENNITVQNNGKVSNKYSFECAIKFANVPLYNHDHTSFKGSINAKSKKNAKKFAFYIITQTLLNFPLKLSRPQNLSITESSVNMTQVVTKQFQPNTIYSNINNILDQSMIDNSFHQNNLKSQETQKRLENKMKKYKNDKKNNNKQAKLEYTIGDVNILGEFFVIMDQQKMSNSEIMVADEFSEITKIFKSMMEQNFKEFEYRNNFASSVSLIQRTSKKVFLTIKSKDDDINEIITFLITNLFLDM